MCGIAGLYTKSPGAAARSSASTSRACSSSCRSAGPTAPASRSTATRRRRARARSSLCASRSRPTTGSASAPSCGATFGRRLGAERPRHAMRCSSSTASAERAQAWLRRASPRAAHDERRRARSRSTRRPGRPTEFVRRFQLDEHRRQPRARPHADGDREPRHDRALAPVLDRPRPVPRAQRLAVEPQPPAARAAARGDPLPDRQRHRGRSRLPDLAPARGRERSSRRSRAASRTSTASTRSRSARADGFAVLRDPIACKPAVMAETDEWVAMASEYRAIAVLPGAEDAVTSGSPSPARVYSWRRERCSR